MSTKHLAKIIADTISPAGHRITTMEIRLWKPLQAELNTHRALSKSSASSRAIPLAKVRQAVLDDPYIPVEWGRNGKGMQADGTLNSGDAFDALNAWLNPLSHALRGHKEMERLGVHKQIANRLLEPWLQIPILVTATEWKNFFALRCHPDAQPDLRVVAEAMRDAMAASVPREGKLHVPYIKDGETAEDRAVRYACAARCARLSYRLVDGKESTLEDDIALAHRLKAAGHWSPFEHVAQSGLMDDRYDNFIGWISLRHTYGDTAHGDFRETAYEGVEQ